MMVYNNPMMLKKMSKMQLIRKVIRDTTQAQKTQMLKLVLARTSKAGLIKLCIAISKNKLMKLKTLTTSKGMNRKTARPKAFPKKRKAKTKRTGKPKNAKVGDRFRAKNGRMMKVVKGGKVQFV